MRACLAVLGALAIAIASASPSFARMSVPKTTCEISPTAIVVKSQEFLGENQSPNVLTFTDSGKVLFSHSTSEIQWTFPDVDLVRYAPVPLVLNLYTLTIVDGKRRTASERPSTYITADCLSKVRRRFDAALTFSHGF